MHTVQERIVKYLGNVCICISKEWLLKNPKHCRWIATVAARKKEVRNGERSSNLKNRESQFFRFKKYRLVNNHYME